MNSTQIVDLQGKSKARPLSTFVDLLSTQRARADMARRVMDAAGAGAGKALS